MSCISFINMDEKSLAIFFENEKKIRMKQRKFEDLYLVEFDKILSIYNSGDLCGSYQIKLVNNYRKKMKYYKSCFLKTNDIIDVYENTIDLYIYELIQTTILPIIYEDEE